MEHSFKNAGKRLEFSRMGASNVPGVTPLVSLRKRKLAYVYIV